jgi:hypothetical protein
MLVQHGQRLSRIAFLPQFVNRACEQSRFLRQRRWIG